MDITGGRKRSTTDVERPEEYVTDILRTQDATEKENVKRRSVRTPVNRAPTKIATKKVTRLSPPLEVVTRAKSRSTSGESQRSTETEDMSGSEPIVLGMTEEEENNKRLEVIDKLYALGIGQYISLPQIVVVGDQSSGKSSVLEAITGLSFPRDSELCTRFPTQIVFERSPYSKVEVSFVRLSKETECATFKREGFNAATLKRLFEKAHHEIGISNNSALIRDSKEKVNFSRDTLRIKVLGPTNQHFSVLDLPGLFRKPTEGKSTTQDMALVRELVEGAMKNERSIIMAVTPANVDAATQEVLHMAERYDPNHERTIGILTKPDIVDEGTEDKILDFARIHRFSVVCNRSQKNTNSTNAERNQKELEFFQRSPWCLLPEDLKGISSLKQRLFSILDNFAREEFPKLGAELSEKIAEVERQLISLGDVRITSEQQRLYLLKMATEFQQITCNAIDASYHRNKCLMSNTTLKLATSIVNISEAFEDRVWREGHQWKFSDGNKSTVVFPSAFPRVYNSGLVSDAPQNDTTRPAGTEPKREVPFPWSSYLAKYPELKTVVKLSTSPYQPNEGIDTWIRTEHLSYRSMEVGNSNSSLLPSLFSEQSANWKGIAQHYVSTAIYTVHHFIKTLIDYVCGSNDEIKNRIWHKLRPTLLITYNKAIDHADFLIQVESEGHKFTLNHYFAENLKKVRAERNNPPKPESANATPGLFRANTEATDNNPFCFSPKPKHPNNTSSLSSVPGNGIPSSNLNPNNQNVNISNIDSEVQDIHDNLQAYYKVARKRFVDAVCKQAVDHFLICSADGPLKIFSPEFIGGLDAKALEEIAGERPTAKEVRTRLTEKLNKLREGQDVLAY